MIRYAQTALCRVQALRDHFGEPRGERCGTCDNCRHHAGIRREVLAAEARGARHPGAP